MNNFNIIYYSIDIYFHFLIINSSYLQYYQIIKEFSLYPIFYPSFILYVMYYLMKFKWMINPLLKKFIIQ